MPGGVAILLNKSLAYKVIHVSVDPGGRYIILVLEIGAVKYAFVYVLTPFSPGILYTIQEKLAPLQLTRVVWAEDFNSVLQADLDSSNSQRLSCVELGSWAQTFHLTEIWKNDPLNRFYSHYSASHKSGSCIDLAFSSRLMSSIWVVSYLPAGILDHSLMKIIVKVGGSWAVGV